MFPQHDRYKTRGVDEALKDQLQNALWQILDRNLEDGKPLDYLQVFELFTARVDGKPVQCVRHRQEQPNRNRLHVLKSIGKPASNLTVWIIDDGAHCTMLLPDEY
ncbi:DUF960 family protein [Paenibacillus sp. PAMC21692]|uniref:DUF960 family protein n=1 Tax=Paenibacillus sp. PAMC21692 TaxID=2762320 RepID=UPI00164CF1B9|nr:DUF960 family protein [Paenibacillus sp. PAMC21692]QNK57435.1 DUF960 domain-containing protein [Paenibacillus sp. PAMC21692]